KISEIIINKDFYALSISWKFVFHIPSYANSLALWEIKNISLLLKYRTFYKKKTQQFPSPSLSIIV
ncbi:hypothetical protein HMPREF9073_01849, partial [Capnocytophaga sp. oral taxon 326 str. F0382]